MTDSDTSIEPTGLRQRVRVHGKRALKRVRLVESFCKACGRSVTDYDAPDSAWQTVEPHITHGSVLCYGCFSEAYTRLTGDPVCWRLTPPRGDS